MGIHISRGYIYDRSSSHQLELIINMQHRQLVAKLRSGNHDLRIETGRHCIPKVPEQILFR